MKQIICDVCGKEVTNRVAGKIKARNGEWVEIVAYGRWNGPGTPDVCPTCIHKSLSESQEAA